MTWIDERIRERDERQRRSNLILQQAEKVFAALWDEIMNFIGEAMTKGFTLATNGSPSEREIIRTLIPMPAGRSISNPAHLYVKVVREKGIISATGPGVNIQFALHVRNDDVVCLTRDDKELSVQAAAIAILDPFLFPQ